MARPLPADRALRARAHIDRSRGNGEITHKRLIISSSRRAKIEALNGPEPALVDIKIRVSQAREAGFKTGRVVKSTRPGFDEELFGSIKNRSVRPGIKSVVATEQQPDQPAVMSSAGQSVAHVSRSRDLGGKVAKRLRMMSSSCTGRQRAGTHSTLRRRVPAAPRSCSAERDQRRPRRLRRSNKQGGGREAKPRIPVSSARKLSRPRPRWRSSVITDSEAKFVLDGLKLTGVRTSRSPMASRACRSPTRRHLLGIGAADNRANRTIYLSLAISAAWRSCRRREQMRTRCFWPKNSFHQGCLQELCKSGEITESRACPEVLRQVMSCQLQSKRKQRWPRSSAPDYSGRS